MNLCLQQRVSAVGEVGRLGLLPPKRTDDAHAREIFPCVAQHGVQPLLHPLIQRHGQQHDTEYHGGQERNDNDKDECTPRIHGERHDHGAENDKRRAHEQAQHKVETGLHLIDITCQAGDGARAAETVKLGVGQRLQMRVQRVAYPRRKANGGFCGKILRRQRADKTDNTETDQQRGAAADQRAVVCGNADVDDPRHDERDEQLKQRFQHFEQRRHHTFAVIAL